jgi:hypothetical protein
MLNFGLKDTRRKPLIASGVISLLTNGSSDASMMFENLEYIVLISSGESDGTLQIVSNFNILLESNGESCATIGIYNDPLEPNIEEIYEGISKLKLIVSEKSSYTLTESGSSQINILTNNKSKLYG